MLSGKALAVVVPGNFTRILEAGLKSIYIAQSLNSPLTRILNVAQKPCQDINNCVIRASQLEIAKKDLIQNNIANTSI